MGRNRFHYPEKPLHIPEEDWNPLEQDLSSEFAPPEKISESSPPSEQPAAPPTPEKEGFTRLVDFVKKHLSEKRAQKDPEFRKRQNAIQAYEKMKKAS